MMTIQHASKLRHNKSDFTHPVVLSLAGIQSINSVIKQKYLYLTSGQYIQVQTAFSFINDLYTLAFTYSMM